MRKYNSKTKTPIVQKVPYNRRFLMVRELLWDLHTINSDEGKALFEMTVGQQNGPTVFVSKV